MSLHESVTGQPPEAKDDGKRVRTLTEKGVELYEAQKLKHKNKFINSWDKVNRYIAENEELSETTPNIDIELIKKLQREVSSLYDEYRLTYDEYVSFLLRSGTEDSIQERENILTESENKRQHTDNFRQKVYTIYEMIKQSERHEVKSVKESEIHVTKSVKSEVSHSSKLSNVLILKQAQAEAAKVKRRYAEKQAALLKEKALLIESEQVAEAARLRKKSSLEADLKFLDHQKELEACIAETNALAKKENASVKSRFNLPEDDPMVRVENFVNKQSQLFERQEAVKTEPYFEPEPLTERQVDKETVLKHEVQEPKINNETDKPPSYADGLIKFLLRKDLTLSRLSVFNDKPENYITWKSSFSEVMNEMGVSNSEEIDLLVKWLGVESRKFALSIRAANATDPEKRG